MTWSTSLTKEELFNLASTSHQNSVAPWVGMGNVAGWPVPGEFSLSPRNSVDALVH